jgi:hypothetical protein
MNDKRRKASQEIHAVCMSVGLYVSLIALEPMDHHQLEDGAIQDNPHITILLNPDVQ